MKHRPGIGSTETARALRRSPTDAETAMWRLLRESFPEARFRRQVPIRHFTADFASHRAKLVIEVDGGQHSEAIDAERTKLIEAEGYQVIRFWNNEVLENPEGVWRTLSDILDSKPLPSMARGWGGVGPPETSRPPQPPPPPDPPPSRGRAPEPAFIASLRALATSQAARGLLDDAAVLTVGGTALVLTHDVIVEGVHYLRADPPEDVAWKLLAVNLSDLAGKGARPLGALMGYSLGDAEWDRRFVEGLRHALLTFNVPLLGGDTVSPPLGAPRSLGLTAIGEASGPVPSRSGARAGDEVWVSGSIGDAGAGLAIARGDRDGPDALALRYRRPLPRLDAGQALAPVVSAMMDISDGLLIDASRLAKASGLSVTLDVGQIPLSSDYICFAGADQSARLAAATAGDDYELLFSTRSEQAGEIGRLSARLGLPLTRIGQMREGAGLNLFDNAGPVPLPERLGFEHGPA
jgi:thiamine-monophosphate kinase